MVKLKEIPRTATFAWSPTGSDPLLVTGTVAGAVDADFSSTTQLELWDLSLLDRSPESFDLSPRIALDTSARYEMLFLTTKLPFCCDLLRTQLFHLVISY